MKKLLLALLFIIFVSGISYSSSYTEAIEKLAKSEGISYKEAKKKYDKTMNTLLVAALKEKAKEPHGLVTDYDLFKKIEEDVNKDSEEAYYQYGRDNNEVIPFFIGDTICYYMSGIPTVLDYCDYVAMQNVILEYNPFKPANIYQFGDIDTKNRKFTLGYAYYDDNNNLIAVFSRTAQCKKHGTQYETDIIEVTLEFPNGKIYKNKKALDYMFGKRK